MVNFICCVFLIVYRFNLQQSTGIRAFLQKYKHPQTPDVADLCHCERDY